MIDAPDLDTALARSLNVQGLLPLDTLRALLGRSRAARPEGPSLARLLLDHGHLTEAQVRDLLRPLLHPTVPTSDLPKALAWQAGSAIGAYVLEEQIGAGGMGVVHRVRHVETGAPYALKSVAANTPDELQRFLRETRAMSAVDGHPNVARVHASGVEAGRAYLVMELAGGGDLRARLASGPLSNAEAATLVHDLALGVEHLHSRGVLHRDLKPSNILFDDQGTPKLVDFGLARLAQQESLTKTGEVLGTPSHMAPEQALGDRASIDERTDVYGLGALLYHCLTGRPPSDGGSLLAVLDAVVHKVPERPSRSIPTIDGRLDAIALKALEKQSQRRYPSAAALAADLAAYLRGESPPRSGLALAASLAVVVALVGLAGLGLRSLPVEPPTAGPATTTKSVFTEPPWDAPGARSPRPPAPIAPVGSVDWPTWKLCHKSETAARHDARLAYLPAAGGLLMFGGRNRARSIQSLAVWNPTRPAWEPRGRGSKERPELLLERGRTRFGLAVDRARGVLVVVGGVTRRGDKSPTVRSWEPGGGWNHPVPGWRSLPAPRWGHELAYDPHRRLLYAFGGRTTEKAVTNSLLQFDGQDWSEVEVSGDRRPPPREQCALAYDPHHRRLVIFGGRRLDAKGEPDKVLGDLWSFDGETWTQVLNAQRRPQPRRGARLVYLEAGYLALVGGSPSPNAGPGLPDLWLLQGTQWSPLHLGLGPRARWAAAAGWDPARGVLLVSGGFGNRPAEGQPWPVLDTVWELHGLDIRFSLPQRGIDQRSLSLEQRRDSLQRPGDWLAEAAARLGADQPRLVLEYCNKALTLLDKEARPALRAAILLRRGRALERLRRSKRAIADFTRALELAPDLHEALSLRVLSYSRLDQRSHALADLNRYLEQLPRPTEFYRRGATLRDMGRIKEAISDFNRTLAGSTSRESHHALATKALSDIKAAQGQR